jgi:hypothetical protein
MDVSVRITISHAYQDYTYTQSEAVLPPTLKNYAEDEQPAPFQDAAELASALSFSVNQTVQNSCEVLQEKENDRVRRALAAKAEAS